MKLHKLLFFLIPFYFSCTKERPVNYVIFSGTIENPIIDSLVLWDINFKHIYTIHLDINNSFCDTIPISKGYYEMNDRQNSINLFFKPSMNLDVTISYNENVPTSLFQNNGAYENNYLQQKTQFDKNFEKVTDYKYFLNLDEEVFLKLTDSINTEKVEFLKDQKYLDIEFLMFETFAIKYEKASLLNRYYYGRGEFINQPDFKVSNNYPNPYEDIDFLNEKLLLHPDFGWSLHGFVFFKMDDEGVDKQNSLLKLETIDKEFKNQKIKDQVAYESIRFQTKDIVQDDIYSKYMSMVENELYRKEIEEKYSNLKKISKGAISPSFELYDLNDDLVTLESLRGKLVYIDIWATYCIPCVKEIPALNKLEKEFKNKEIYFVSICLKDTKEQFERFVKEKKMGGIQLFAPDENINFFKNYLVRGIPRFILVDKEGYIIDAHTYRPSDPKLVELIQDNL